MSFAEFYTAAGGLGDAYSKGLQGYRQKQLLGGLGGQLQAGDYAGAAKSAFDAGDTDTGLALMKLGETRRQTLLGEQASQDLVNGLGFGGGQTGLGALGSPRADASSRALPSFADTSGQSGDYVANLFKRESNNNPLAQASTSSARGLGQFTRGTWNQVARQHPELSLTPVANGQDGRIDPNQMVRATKALTADNEGILSRAGLPVNDATRYATHMLGAGGGPRLVAGAMRNPDAPAVSFVAPEQARANRNVFYNRDGSPKSAGQVMSEYGRSFGGGGAVAQAPGRPPAGAPVAFAGDEAQTQGLEQRMGMVPTPSRVAVADDEAGVQRLERSMGMVPPTQTADASDPRADMPMEGTAEAQFRIPPGDGPASTGSITGVATRMQPSAPTALPSSDPNTRTFPRSPVPTLEQSAPTSRTMVIPGEPQAVTPNSDLTPPARVAANAQAQRGGQTANDATIGNVPAASIAQSPLGQRIPILMRALANPYLPDAQRQLAQTMLKEGLEQTRMPDGVKEYMWARANGMTQARTPAEYARESKGPTLLSPGQSVYDERSNQIRITAPDRTRSNVTDDVDQRRAAAADLGLSPGSPQYQSYVLTGKMPREDAQPLSASDKKAILEADDGVVSAETAIGNLTAAKELSAKAYAGPFASQRGRLTGTFGSETGQATQELDNLVTTNALGQLKAIFGAAPTEGERKILLDIQGSSELPHALRVKIYDRAIALAERRLDLNRERASELRGQTYYKPGSGPGADRGGAPTERRALPAPSNRPGAVSAPPPGAVDLLRSRPELQGQFDEKYGAGAAARILRGQ